MGDCHNATKSAENAKFHRSKPLSVTLFSGFVTQCVAVFRGVLAQTMHCTAWSVQSQKGAKREMQSHFLPILGCGAVMQCLDAAVHQVYMGSIAWREHESSGI